MRMMAYGISAENKLMLFLEGFSTGGSTGFGLFLTKKMLDVYGWTIQELGELGKGAKFEISIPVNSLSGKNNYRISQFSQKICNSYGKQGLKKG